MCRRHSELFGLALLAATVLFSCGADWPQFRGPHSSSVSPESNLPVQWSVDDVDWAIPLAGRCVSGPIVVQGQVVTTSSSGRMNDRLHVWSVDAETGKLLWQRNLWASGRTLCHPLTSMASPTPASDGKKLFVLFASNDFVCLDLQGNVRWMRAIGLEYPLAFDDRGLGSSPLVIGQTIVLQMECQGDGFVLGVDGETGETRWRLRLSKTINWLSPTAARIRGRELALVQGTDRLLFVDPHSGDIVATFEEALGTSIASPVASGPLVFLPYQGLTALKYEPGSREPTVLWQEARLGASASSPVVAGGKLFVLRGTILVCGNAETGEVLWRQRLKGSRFWATPVVAGQHLYAVNAKGLVQVVDISGKEGRVVAENDMGEETLGSPAVADGSLYLRGVRHLWKISGSP
jgi:outer membrane protein assembly factor BamB